MRNHFCFRSGRERMCALKLQRCTWLLPPYNHSRAGIMVHVPKSYCKLKHKICIVLKQICNHSKAQVPYFQAPPGLFPALLKVLWKSIWCINLSYYISHTKDSCLESFLQIMFTVTEVRKGLQWLSGKRLHLSTWKSASQWFETCWVSYDLFQCLPT